MTLFREFGSRRRRTAISRGLAAYAREDYATAFRELSAAESSGDADAEALYRLGLLYARGGGVIANLAEALLYYQRAAQQGHAEAQFQLSLVHLGRSGAHRSVPFQDWYRAASERDKEAADRNRELFFPNGFDVQQDAAEAARWSRAAAEQGIADAQANTGLIYARGVGCEPDYAEARRWYLLAAQKQRELSEKRN